MTPQIKAFLREKGKELALYEGEIVTLLSFRVSIADIVSYLERSGLKVSKAQLTKYVQAHHLRQKAARMAQREVRA